MERKSTISRRDFVKVSGVAGGVAPAAMSPAFASTAVALPAASGANRLIMQYPASAWASRWCDAVPCGNGKFGAAVYGAVHRERILFNHEDLWDYGTATELPDVSRLLPEMRRLLKDGKRQEAADLYVGELGKLGYRIRTAALLPLADLLLTMPPKQAFRNYRRELDMTTGEAVVSWRDGEVDFERRLFVSRTDDVIACVIRCSRPGALNATAALAVHDLADAATRRGRAATPKEPQSSAGDGFLVFTAKTQAEADFGAVGRVIPTGGTARAQASSIVLDNADGALILVKLFAEEDKQTAVPRLKQELSALPADYDRLLAPHAKAHRELFERVKLNLHASEGDRALSNEQILLNSYKGDVPAVLVEKMWAYGRYLLISSSRKGGQPPSLLGRWCGDYEGFWTFNMANENIQMIYWQALCGNLPDLNLALFDYYESMLSDFRKNARNLFGCRGILVPAVTTKKTGLMPGNMEHILFYTGPGAWISAHFYDHYRYTGDKDFLRQRALPFMREVALFYEDFTFEDENGHLVFAPSNSPENAPRERSTGTPRGGCRSRPTPPWRSPCARNCSPTWWKAPPRPACSRMKFRGGRRCSPRCRPT